MRNSQEQLRKLAKADAGAARKRFRMTAIHRVALLINLTTSYGRQILEGVNSNPARGNWELLAESWGDIGTEDLLSHKNADGLIVDVGHRQAEVLRNSPLPKVVVSGLEVGEQSVSVAPDYDQIGSLAAQHFLQRGYAQLAFLGSSSASSRELLRSFLTTAARQGVPVNAGISRMSWSGRRESESQKLAAWLASLPLPCGLFAADDIPARRVLQAARALGLRVPHQLAVLGVGDYELVNTITQPPLSTVVVPAREIGLRAADSLAALLSNRPVEQRTQRVPSPCIATRGSTDLHTWSDPVVADALTWLKERFSQRIFIPSLAEALSVSRRQLEQRFRKTVGHGPAEELRRIRLQRAQRLLRETDWGLAPVARASGLQTAERLCNLFRDRLDMTPGEFRQRTSRPPRREA